MGKARRVDSKLLCYMSMLNRFFGSNKSKTAIRYSFTSFADMLKIVDTWLSGGDWNFDLVVGIPRSGLLVANLIALRLEKPLSTIDSLTNGSIWLSKLIKKPSEYKKVLLVDDSISTGESMRVARECLQKLLPHATLTTAALIASDESAALVDRYATIIQPRRIFEWNMLHSKKGRVGFDLDGVLAEEIPHGLESDEPAYIEWITGVRSHLIPTYKIDVIITNRLQKYRVHTEGWLKEHGVRYGELIMCPAGSKDERKRMKIPHKIAALSEYNPDVFFESDEAESDLIARETGIPVLCTTTKRIYDARE